MIPNYDEVVESDARHPSPYKRYLLNNKLHRTDGPALVNSYSSSYYLYGLNYLKPDFDKKLRELNIEYNLKRLNL
jgi:hypothetical protein